MTVPSLAVTLSAIPRSGDRVERDEMNYTDGSSVVEGPDPLPGCVESCAFPVSGEHRPECHAVTPERRTAIGNLIIEAFTIGDSDDHREVMEIAEAELPGADFLQVEVHTQGLHEQGPVADCLICSLIPPAVD